MNSFIVNFFKNLFINEPENNFFTHGIRYIPLEDALFNDNGLNSLLNKLAPIFEQQRENRILPDLYRMFLDTKYSKNRKYSNIYAFFAMRLFLYFNLEDLKYLQKELPIINSIYLNTNNYIYFINFFKKFRDLDKKGQVSISDIIIEQDELRKKTDIKNISSFENFDFSMFRNLDCSTFIRECLDIISKNYLEWTYFDSKSDDEIFYNSVKQFSLFNFIRVYIEKAIANQFFVYETVNIAPHHFDVVYIYQEEMWPFLYSVFTSHFPAIEVLMHGFNEIIKILLAFKEKYNLNLEILA